MKYNFVLFIFLVSSVGFTQELELMPFFDGEKWGLSNGKEYVVYHKDSDSISPISVTLYDNNQGYKSFNSKIASLIDTEAKILVSGYDDYARFSNYNLKSNILKTIKNDKTGVFDLTKKKEIIPNRYDDISLLQFDNKTFYLVKDIDKGIGVLNDSFVTVVELNPNLRTVYVEEVITNGTSKFILELVDENYDKSYRALDGSSISVPVVESNDDFLMEVEEIEVVEESSDDIVTNGPSCRRLDELIIDEGKTYLKSCKKMKVINVPKKYKIESLIKPKNNLQTEFAYLLNKKKKGIYSISDETIVLEPQFDDLTIFKDSYRFFLSKNKNKYGIEIVSRNYNGVIDLKTISKPLYSKIIKSDKLRGVFIVHLPNNILGFLKVSEDITLYLPQTIKKKYAISY